MYIVHWKGEIRHKINHTQSQWFYLYFKWIFVKIILKKSYFLSVNRKSSLAGSFNWKKSWHSQSTCSWCRNFHVSHFVWKYIYFISFQAKIIKTIKFNHVTATNKWLKVANSKIELLQNWEYSEFSQPILGYKHFQLKFRSIALINGNYIKHIAHSIVKGLFVPLDLISWGKPTFAELRITTIERSFLIYNFHISNKNTQKERISILFIMNVTPNNILVGRRKPSIKYLLQQKK